MFFSFFHLFYYKIFVFQKIYFKQPVMLIPSETQNNNPSKLTVFKPPAYIYKLCKYQNKYAQNLNFELYFNKDHSLRKYTNVRLDLSDFKQLSLYQWRKNQTAPVNNVVYIELLQHKLTSSAVQTDNNSAIAVNIYVEHIQKILADMINLNLNESIYVLNECLLAYRCLFHKFSAVSINKFHIGLNAQGKIKIWINQNLASNNIEKKRNDCQTSHNQILIIQTAIVNKIIHMIGLLSNTNCKYFYFGLQKQLTLKRFTFNNCLQYIHEFVSKTNNLQIPQNLYYMLPKKPSFCLQRSNVKFDFNNLNKKQKPQKRDRKLSQNLSFNNIHTFKHFGNIVRSNNRQNTQCTKKSRIQNQLKYNIYSKRYSQNIPIKIINSAVSATGNDNTSKNAIEINSKKETKVSLQIITEKTRKTSIKSNGILASKKSNISLNKQRPSICILPSFINKSTKNNQRNQTQQNLDDDKSQLNEKLNRQKSNSLVSSKSKDYHSLINSKIVSSRTASQVVQNWKTRGDLSKTDPNKNKDFGEKHTIKRILQEDEILYLNKTQLNSNNNKLCSPSSSNSCNRSRSVSANIKFGNYKPSDFLMRNVNNSRRNSIMMQVQNQQHNQNSVPKKQNASKQSSQRNNETADKISTNSISNDHSTKKRSFLTKTNYDSVTQDNEKNSSSCRMNFSSMSIQNRITNKNFDLCELSSAQKQDGKRSLISFKYGFQQILQNPSCKQVEEQNQSKSYNGSSLKNTQNITELIQRNQFNVVRKNSKKEEQSSSSQSNNYSFGNTSNKGLRKKINLNDSTQETWNQMKQKNEQLLIKNQWKKTINNLQSLQDMTLNQSIVDVSDSIIEHQNDRYAHVRLDKLDRLGRNMVYSIIKKSEDNL